MAPGFLKHHSQIIQALPASILVLRQWNYLTVFDQNFAAVKLRQGHGKVVRKRISDGLFLKHANGNLLSHDH